MRNVFWAALAAIFAWGSPAFADNFPSRPITIIVPFAAGGPSDVLARVLADHMQKTLGQPVLIEDITGAGGSIGVSRAVHSAPDGYTISYGHLGTHVCNGAIYKLDYDLVTDLEPVALLPNNPMVIVSKNALPTKTLPELLTWLKSRPQPATAGTAGVGSGSHIAGLALESTAGLKVQYIPYRGTGPALNDLVAGNIDIIVDQLSNSINQIRAGNIRAYAVTDSKRADQAPDIPTTDEGGLPGYHMTLWSGLWVPKGTPRAIVDRLNKATNEALNDPDVRKHLEQLGLTMPPADQSTPEALGAWQKSEIARWWPIIKAANIQMN